jgi:hypothetical protein
MLKKSDNYEPEKIKRIMVHTLSFLILWRRSDAALVTAFDNTAADSFF